MTLNQRIKYIREMLGLSQAKFAIAISISNGYIAGLELGKRKVNDRIIKLICSEFNVNERWLRYEEGDIFNANHTSDEASKIVSLFEDLRPEYQTYVLNQMQQLLDIQDNDSK